MKKWFWRNTPAISEWDTHHFSSWVVFTTHAVPCNEPTPRQTFPSSSHLQHGAGAFPIAKKSSRSLMERLLLENPLKKIENLASHIDSGTISGCGSFLMGNCKRSKFIFGKTVGFPSLGIYSSGYFLRLWPISTSKLLGGDWKRKPKIVLANSDFFLVMNPMVKYHLSHEKNIFTFHHTGCLI